MTLRTRCSPNAHQYLPFLLRLTVVKESAGHAGMALDLRPYMQRTPFVLQGNASLARAYRLFRTMGLHHLYVGPSKPQVIGLLSRKVLTPAPGPLTACFCGTMCCTAMLGLVQ